MHYQFTFLEPKLQPGRILTYVHLSELIRLEIEDIDDFVKERLPEVDGEIHSRAVKIISRFISSV